MAVEADVYLDSTVVFPPGKRSFFLGKHVGCSGRKTVGRTGRCSEKSGNFKLRYCSKPKTATGGREFLGGFHWTVQLPHRQEGKSTAGSMHVGRRAAVAAEDGVADSVADRGSGTGRILGTINAPIYINIVLNNSCTQDDLF